jgi:hypothetical protein
VDGLVSTSPLPVVRAAKVDHRCDGALRSCYVIAPERPVLTFGRNRDCTVVLDAGDVTISGRAGAIRWAGHHWLLENTSSFAPFTVHADGREPAILGPDARPMPIGDRDVIEVPAAGQLHSLQLFDLGAPAPALPAVPRSGTAELSALVPAGVHVTPDRNQRELLAALCLGWLFPEQFAPRPTRTEELHRLLTGNGDHSELSRAALRKRLGVLRRRLAPLNGRELVDDFDLYQLAERYRLCDVDDAARLPGLPAVVLRAGH